MIAKPIALPFLAAIAIGITTGCASRGPASFAPHSAANTDARAEAMSAAPTEQAPTLDSLIREWQLGNRDAAIRRAKALDPADDTRLRITSITHAQYAALPYDEQTATLADAYARQQAWGDIMHALAGEAKSLALAGQPDDARRLLDIVRASGRANSDTDTRSSVRILAIFAEALIRYADDQQTKLGL